MFESNFRCPFSLQSLSSTFTSAFGCRDHCKDRVFLTQILRSFLAGFETEIYCESELIAFGQCNAKNQTVKTSLKGLKLQTESYSLLIGIWDLDFLALS